MHITCGTTAEWYSYFTCSIVLLLQFYGMTNYLAMSKWTLNFMNFFVSCCYLANKLIRSYTFCFGYKSKAISCIYVYMYGKA